MNDSHTPEPVDPELKSVTPAAEPPMESPGRVIRQTREREGMTVEELAAQTRLSRSTLDAIERDDFRALGEQVYAHGYYRKCAKVLNLDADALIGGYRRLSGNQGRVAPTKLLVVSDNDMIASGREGSMRRWLGFIVVIGVLVGVYWYLHTRSSTPAVPVPALPAAPAPSQQGAAATDQGTISVAATPVAPAVGTSAEPSPAAAASAAPAPAPASESPAASQPQAPTVAPAANADTSSSADAAQALTLTFHDASWVRIEDADGKMLLSGVIQGGETQTLHGKPPYSVFLGNAPGVTVSYGGSAFDTQPYLKPNSTARFSVPR